MNNKNNLNKSDLRRRLLLLYHQDGILDLVVGSCLALLTLVMAFDQGAFIGLIGIPAIFYIPFKDQIALPRIGLIRFDKPSKNQARLTLVAIFGVIALFAFVLIFILLPESGGSIRTLLAQNEILIFALLLAGVLFLIGLLMHNQRFLLYAVISLAFIGLAAWQGLRMWIPVAGCALIILVTGTGLLIRFRHQFPKQDGE
ncbi:hypothetical protein JR338_13035 (plasmid) [Chloroflexota bacterium]|nr:hypothetical protein JR338_13035 [Chloroflexota bacterium]